MQIIIKALRRDNKSHVSYRFDNGRIINKLVHIDDIRTLNARYPMADIMGHVNLTK